MKTFGAESFGSFLSLILSSSLVILYGVKNGLIQSYAWPIAYGSVLFAVTSLVGRISGGHLNPAVTIGFWTAKRLSSTAAFSLIAAQVIGGLIAGFCLMVITPHNARLIYSVTYESAPFLLLEEAGFAIFFMFSLLALCKDGFIREVRLALYTGLLAALFLAMAESPSTTVFLNPVRWVTAAILLNDFRHGWIFVFIPCIGSIAGLFFCKLIADPECCSSVKTDTQAALK